MDDIISQGEEPRPPGRRRLAAAGVLAALVAVAVVARLPGSAGPAHETRLSASSSYWLGGLSEPVSRGFRLPLAGVAPGWLWPATGRVLTIGGLPRLATGYGFTRLGGGWAVQADPGVPAGCGGYCAGPSLPVYYLASGARSAVRVGTATSVAPAAMAGAMWLSSERRGADVGSAAAAARQVTGTGVLVGPAVRLPAGYMIVRGTVAGLLLTRQVPAAQNATYELWNPARARAVRTFRHVVAASASEIAWTSASRALRAVRVLDLDTGQVRAFRLLAGSSPISAEFSPDGRFLAVLAGIGLRYGVAGALAVRIEVAVITAGRLLVMPPASLWSGGLAGFGWPANTDMLVTELGIASAMRLTTWQPGRHRYGTAVLAPDAMTTGLVIG